MDLTGIQAAPIAATAQPIASAVAARPDLAEPAGTTASKMISKSQEAHRAATAQATELDQAAPDVARARHVDVYA